MFQEYSAIPSEDPTAQAPQVEQMRQVPGYLDTPGDDRSTVLLRALNQLIAQKKVPYKAAAKISWPLFM